MSIEQYAVFRATPGCKADQAALEIGHARVAANKVRRAFNKAHGAIGGYGHDGSCVGVIFAAEPLPEGWKRDHAIEGGIVAVPDKKTKLGKELAKKLAALPALPGASAFTVKIGGEFKIVGRTLRYCYFERYDGVLFVMTPKYSSKSEWEDEEATPENETFFTPEGCERVPLSAYYATKEASEAKKLSTKEAS